MADVRLIVNSTMRALVDSFGCQDAVAELLAVRWGHGVSKGTVSRKLSGDLDWAVTDVIALEDALRRYPVTQVLARRMAVSGLAGDNKSLVEQGATVARETGEAVAAFLTAVGTGRAASGAEAIREIDEAIVELRSARAAIEKNY